MAKSKSTDVAVIENETTDLTQIDDELAGLLIDNAGAGTEDIGAEDIQIPRLKLLQDISDERKKGHDKYVPGAEEGMILNSVTQELYERLEIIPVHRDHHFVVWPSQRGESNQPVGDFDTELEAQEASSPSDEVYETVTFTVLYRDATVEDSEFSVALIDFTGTKLKVARNLATQIKMMRIPVRGQRIQPAIWMTRWTLDSVRETNKRKESYFNFRVKFGGLLKDRALLTEVRDLHEMAAAQPRQRVVVDAEVETDDGDLPSEF